MTKRHLEFAATCFVAFPFGLHASLEKVLDQPTTVEFVDTPLMDVAKFLSKMHGTKITIDEKELNDEGIGIDEPINLRLTKVTLRSALRLILRDLELTFVPNENGGQITTRFAAEERPITRLYDFSKMPGMSRVPPAALVGIVQSMTSGPWKQIDGAGGTASVTARNLQITQHAEGQYEIQNLLRQISRAISGPGRVSQTPIEKTESKLQQKLLQKVTVEFVDTPLSDAVEFLSRQVGTTILIDGQSLEDDGLTTDDPVTLKANSVSLDTVLGKLLPDLAWVIDDEVIQITTPITIADRLLLRVYDTRGKDGRLKITPVRLLQLIQGKRQLGKWVDRDGTGGTASVLGRLLIIRQDSDAHGKIAKIVKRLVR